MKEQVELLIVEQNKDVLKKPLFLAQCYEMLLVIYYP